MKCKTVIKEVHPELLAYYWKEVNTYGTPLQIPMIEDFEISKSDILIIRGTYAYDANAYWRFIRKYQKDQTENKFEWEKLPELKFKVLSIGWQDAINCMDFKYEEIIKTLMTEKYYDEFCFMILEVKYN